MVKPISVVGRVDANLGLAPIARRNSEIETIAGRRQQSRRGSRRGLESIGLGIVAGWVALKYLDEALSTG
jgi:hypothetical protein